MVSPVCQISNSILNLSNILKVYLMAQRVKGGTWWLEEFTQWSLGQKPETPYKERRSTATLKRLLWIWIILSFSSNKDEEIKAGHISSSNRSGYWRVMSSCNRLITQKSRQWPVARGIWFVSHFFAPCASQKTHRHARIARKMRAVELASRCSMWRHCCVSPTDYG